MDLLSYRYSRTGSRLDAHRSGRPGSITPAMKTLIVNSLRQNDELTAADLQVIIRDETGKDVSHTAIRVCVFYFQLTNIGYLVHQMCVCVCVYIHSF